ncbi:hypothetical protein LQU94_03205 [Peptoniphilus sp. KCTC 25270]|uniref:hypothetical protein n=1 Tax=Peptoniphilus sp. KCTC 25270 TaxID=2897414 RepID=UPI001E4377B6|nr:hypothetical protein [Peptoniphilus sp. KCTC 25270]MCD1147123.1 hypothetical protein [Peptoniphilus sp. KCTC 25270]
MKKTNKWMIAFLLSVFALTISSCGKEEAQSKEKLYVDVSAVYEELTPQEMMMKSDLVVEVKYKGTTPPFRVKSATGGDPMTFKDTKFEIVEVFKGNKSVGDSIQVRTLGGEIELEDGVNEVTIGDYDKIKFTGKNHFILFLYYPLGSDYNTREDYYAPTNGPSSILKSIDGRAISYETENEFTNVDDLRKMEKGGTFLEDYKENLNQSYQSGQISEEEYQDAIDLMDQYGEKLE